MAQVGVGVFILDQAGRFILGKRKGSHGEGTWALPGGHLISGETFEACAAREVLEETGLQVADFRFLTATNNVMQREGKHYVTIFLACKISGERTQPELLEPEKCEEWEWVSWIDMKHWAEMQLTGIGNPERIIFSPLVDLLSQRHMFSPILDTQVT